VFATVETKRYRRDFAICVVNFVNHKPAITVCAIAAAETAFGFVVKRESHYIRVIAALNLGEGIHGLNLDLSPSVAWPCRYSDFQIGVGMPDILSDLGGKPTSAHCLLTSALDEFRRIAPGIPVSFDSCTISLHK